MQTESPRILLIDDSLDELHLLSDMLRSEQWRLVMATDGRQGYERAVAIRPDLILMDVVMPKMDGLTAARLLKSDPATYHIPVIFISCKNSPEERLQGLRAGGVDYVSKPFMAEEVVLRVQVHLRLLRPHAVPTLNPTADLVPGVRRSDAVLAKAAAKIIQDRLESLPSVADLAGMVGTYEKRLVQIFRQEFKMTVAGFIREERIRYARHLLADTAMPVHYIGELIGMNNAGNFATAFRDRVGVSPTQYRDAARTANPEQ